MEERVVGFFFSNRTYNSKEDVINSVVQYHKDCHRAYKVTRSDKRSYKAVCVNDFCSFVVQFAFSSSFKKPRKFISHSCSIISIDASSYTANCHTKAVQLSQMDEIHELFISNGRDLRPKDVWNKVESIGIEMSYTNCLRAYQCVQKNSSEMTLSSISSYHLILRPLQEEAI